MTEPTLHQLFEEFNTSQAFLVAMGDTKRQQIVISLLHHPLDQGLRVSDFLTITGLSRPAVSHHLKILKDADIVSIRREGTRNFYVLTMRQSLEHLIQLCQDVLTTLNREGSSK